MDTIGPLQKSFLGNSYAITLVCDLTKYLVTIPIANKEANTIAKSIFEDFILIYGIPKSIRTDCGTEYRNDIMKELCKLTGIEHNFSTPYHHETLGGIERTHRVFNEYQRAYEHNIDWDVQMKYFTYCYNTSYHGSLNHQYNPFELVFGRRVNDLQILKQPIEPIYNHERYTNILKHTLKIAHERAKDFIQKMKLKNKLYYDKHINPIDLSENDSILIKKEPYNKFHPVYSGPYKIKKIIDENVIFEINQKEHTVHKNRIIKSESK